MKKIFLPILLTLFFTPLSISSILGQNFTISGTLKDASNGEDSIGASVVLSRRKEINAVIVGLKIRQNAEQIEVFCLIFRADLKR